MNLTKNMKAGDTGSPLVVQILNKSDYEPVDLTGASVDFRMFKINDDDTVTTLVDASATVETPETEGTITYNWAAGDTDIAGNHKAQFEITFSGGRVETFPSSGYIEINIEVLP